MEVGSCSYNYSNFDQPQPGRETDKLEGSKLETNGVGIVLGDEKLGSGRSHGGGGTSGVGVNMFAGDVTRKEECERIPKACTKEAMQEEAGEEAKPCEVQQEGGIALWVKWRGKWRACIQCFPNDCSTATAKAMPSYNKKTYVVVFFPNSRTYFWVDLQSACHITESPEPLAFGTHESGRRAVENLDMPKHHMLQVLTTSMLDITDRLPVKAVVESARDVNAWKDFANEAVKAKEYSDISKMLSKLFWMVDPSYYSKEWLGNEFVRWKDECEKANSAQAVENLNKDLVSSILWDDLQPLWDAPEQSAVGAQWKDWKYTVLENRKLLPTIMPSPESTLYVDDAFAKRRRVGRTEPQDVGKVDVAAKRLRVRRSAESPLIDLNTPQAPDIAGLYGEAEKAVSSTPLTPPVVKAKVEEISGSQPSLPTSKRLSSNYQLCAAYMEKKKRQCTRFPSQGSLYCCKHMSLETSQAGKTPTEQKSASPMEHKTIEQKPVSWKPVLSREQDSSVEQKPVIVASQNRSATMISRGTSDRICEGMTKFGRRCLHRAKEGSFFCKKHTFADAPHLNPETGERILQPPSEEKVEHSDQGKPVPTQADLPDEALGQVRNDREDNDNNSNNNNGNSNNSNNVSTSPRKRKAASYFSERSYQAAWRANRIGRLIRSNSGDRIRCLGKCVNGDQCSHRSRPGSSYCEKHQPDITGVQERTEPETEAKKQDAAQLHVKAKSWLSRYMEISNRKADEADEENTPDKLLQWVLEEASRDLPTAECLMELVTQRKEKLGRFLELSELSKVADAEGEAIIAEMNNGPSEKVPDEHMGQQLDKIKCSICSDEFVEMVELGKHWKSSHTTEAHWFLKGYVCNVCSKDFTNKSGFERHLKADHEGTTEIPGFAVCINCDEQFTDFEALFDHVVASHSDHLSAMPTISLPANDFDGEDMHIEDEHPVPKDELKEQSGDESFDLPSSPEELFYDGNETSGELVTGDGGEPMKYKCKICSKGFKTLPELGRHHQAVHMTDHIGTIAKSRTAESGSSRRRKRANQNDALRRIKAALQSVQQSKAVNKAKVPGRPNDEDILSIAREACCETSLQAKLEQKYESVPSQLQRIVVDLCSGEKLPQWAREGHTCLCNCQSGKEVAERVTDTRAHIFRKSSLIKKKNVVLCEDVSFGKECLPIPCVEDEETEPCTCVQCREGKSYHVDSERPWETFNYITKRMLDPSLNVDTKDSQIGCACGKNHCFPKSCLHVYLFDNDNAEASDIWGEEMVGRFPYDDEGRIVLQEGYLVYECNSSCPCHETCPNRILQRGVNVKLEVFKTRHKGWAVRAAQHIPRGTFVCEYLGEVLHDQEANRRGERYDKVGCSYLYDIDVHLNRGRSRRGTKVKPFVIDATKYGNVSRFVNHSCSPNLVNYQVLVESMDSRLAHIGLYASRDIACGEELAYDYRYKLLPGRGCPCHCGSSSCRGRLY